MFLLVIMNAVAYVWFIKQHPLYGLINIYTVFRNI